MHFAVLHAIFDLAMGAVLVRWIGHKLAHLRRHDTVAVIWECLRSELRKIRSPQPQSEAKPAGKLTADLMYR